MHTLLILISVACAAEDVSDVHVSLADTSESSVFPAPRQDTDGNCLIQKKSIGSKVIHPSSKIRQEDVFDFGDEKLHIWPRFETPSDLQKSPQWYAYLKALYGPMVHKQSIFPIDISKFWVLHRVQMKAAGIIPTVNFEIPGCAANELDMFSHWTGGDPAYTMWIRHDPPFQGVPDNQWAEVTHYKPLPYKKNTLEMFKQHERKGYWMYFGLGSGVFYNVGKTKTFQRHVDAVREFLPGRKCGGIGDDCSEHFMDLVTEAAKTLTSLQFLAHADQICSGHGMPIMEILDLHHSGMETCSIPIKGGFGHCSCTCNPTLGTQESLACNLDTDSCSMAAASNRTDASLFVEHTGITVEGMASEGLHTHAKQMRTFISVLALLGPMMIVMWCLCRQGQCSSLLLACFSCVFFGIDNFLNAYASSYLHMPSAHICMVFLLDGIAAFLFHMFLLYYNPSYKRDCEVIACSSKRAMTLMVWTGIFIAIAHLCGNIGFTLERTESGPHQALVGGNVLVVTTFFYFHSGEILTQIQCAGCFLIIVGAVVMSDILNWADNLDSIFAFSWLLVSMAFYAASMISWRLVSMEKEEIPWQPQLSIIYGVMGTIGFLSFSLFFYADGFAEYAKVPLLLLWPLLNVAVSFLGMWSVNLALHKADTATGALTALVDSNAIVLVFLNRVVLNMVPSTTKCAGMVAILVGCACVCFGIRS
jgi:hypothetical protein